LKLLKEVGNMEESQEFYEALLYSMVAVSDIFISEAMHYTENQLYNRF
jgi:hypothetical protein